MIPWSSIYPSRYGLIWSDRSRMVYSAGCRSLARLVVRPSSQAANTLAAVDTVSCHSRSMAGAGAGGAAADAAASRLSGLQVADGVAVSIPPSCRAWRSATSAAVADSPVADHHADTWVSSDCAGDTVTVVVVATVGDVVDGPA